MNCQHNFTLHISSADLTDPSLLSRINKNDDTKGIPSFWLTIFKNVQMLSEMVQEHDEPILKHLLDIKVIFMESNPMVSKL